MPKGVIQTYEQLDKVFKEWVFKHYSRNALAGLIYGPLKRILDNGIKTESLDNLLVDAGIKSPRNFSRYLTFCKKNCVDMFALEKFCGYLPRDYEGAIQNDGIPIGVPVGGFAESKYEEEKTEIPPQTNVGITMPSGAVIKKAVKASELEQRKQGDNHEQGSVQNIERPGEEAYSQSKRAGIPINARTRKSGQ